MNRRSNWHVNPNFAFFPTVLTAISSLVALSSCFCACMMMMGGRFCRNHSLATHLLYGRPDWARQTEWSRINASDPHTHKHKPSSRIDVRHIRGLARFWPYILMPHAWHRTNAPPFKIGKWISIRSVKISQLHNPFKVSFTANAIVKLYMTTTKKYYG